MRPRPQAREAGAFAWVVLLCTSLIACQSAQRPTRELPPGSDRLTGLWDVVLFDEEATRSVYHAPTKGTISFLEPTGRDVAVGRDLPELVQAVPVAYAVWDVDFAGRGFDLRPAGRVPTAVAAIDTAPSAPQVRVVLQPDATTRLLLIGAFSGDSVIGHWQIVADGRTGLVARGRFTLVPRGDSLAQGTRARSP